MARDVAHTRRRPVIVTAAPLGRRARTRLEDRLGDVRVVDLRDSVDEADLVLVPPCSPQTIRCLQAAYPTARVVVVEIHDDEFDIEYRGPVRRLLHAGAARYLTAEGLDDLATQLRGDRLEPPSTRDEHAPALPVGSTDDDVLTALADARAARHAER